MRQNTKRCYGVWKIFGRGYFEITATNKFKKKLCGGGVNGFSHTKNALEKM